MERVQYRPSSLSRAHVLPWLQTQTTSQRLETSQFELSRTSRPQRNASNQWNATPSKQRVKPAETIIRNPDKWASINHFDRLDQPRSWTQFLFQLLDIRQRSRRRQFKEQKQWIVVVVRTSHHLCTNGTPYVWKRLLNVQSVALYLSLIRETSDEGGRGRGLAVDLIDDIPDTFLTSKQWLGTVNQGDRPEPALSGPRVANL